MLRKDRKTPSNLSTTADPDEIARFNKLADEWWKPDGAFKRVHAFNATRVAYLSHRLPVLLHRDPTAPSPLHDVRVLDIGCGAGLTTESIAKLGAKVLGADASEQNILVAKRHAEETGARVIYEQALPEELLKRAARYDVVMSLEVVEHVANLDAFLDAVASLVAPNGLLIIGTLNRTLASYFKAIVGAEYLLKWLPRGTHDWRKFVTPQELDARLSPHRFTVVEQCGVEFNPWTRRWGVSRSLSTNYLQVHRRVVAA